MPIDTPHFGLKAFVLGDAFSAAVDKERFTRIDHHMAFISGIIGPGVIEGWDLSASAPLTLRVSSGWGMIDKNITRTFGYLEKFLLDNNTVYVWMKRRVGVIGQVSAFAGPVFVDYQDITPPAAPTGLAVANKTTSSVSLTWNANTEFDLFEYIVYRSLDNIVFSEIGRTVETSYVDSGLSDDTMYYYYIAAVDLSELVSSFSSMISVKTFKDTTPPGDPSNIRLINSDGSVNIAWREAAFGNIAFYRAYVTPVTSENIPSGAAVIYEVVGTIQHMGITGLTNGQKYEIVLKSVGTNEVESGGIRAYGYPAVYTGPKDISELVITDIENTGVLSKIIMQFDWVPGTDPYDPYDPFPAVSYELRLEEIGDGKVYTSQWIEIPEGLTTQLQVYPMLDSSGQIAYRQITERTEYFVTVRAIAEDGRRSQGFLAVHRTRSFEDPNPPRNMAITQRDDQTLLVSWQNSPSIFLYNAFTFIITDTSTNIQTVVLNASDIGRSTSYSVASEHITPGKDYEFRVKAVDEFGNASSEIYTTFSIPDVSSLPLPPVPSGQIGYAGDGQVDIAWSHPDIPYVKGYRIWRGPDQVSYSASDFQIVETILDPQKFSYTDYEVVNETTYVYFVTTIDIYDRESLNPVDNDYFDYSLVIATPRNSGILTQPTGLSTTVIGNDVRLIWNPTGGQFDGYEIFRSIGNKYSWEKVDITNSAVTSYLDEEVLARDSIYYYIVRKFKNEGDIFVTESRNAVAGGILIGKVTITDGVFDIDLTDVRNIKNLEDPIRERASALIAAHKHEWYSDDDDRRINLGDTVTVSDWTSIDYQTYITETDISQTTTYKVYLNGEESEYLSTLDKESGQLFFERRLAAGDFSYDPNEEFPFSSPPTVEVVFDNLAETQNELSRNRIEGVSAQQVGSGLVEEVQLPGMNHEGRIREKLVPIQIATKIIDEGYRYSTENANEIIGSAVVWYDVYPVADNEDSLLGATSDGIYYSEDFGTTWQRMFESVTPVSKFFYSSSMKLYFALTNRGVLVSGGNSEGSGGFSVWSEIGGAENSKVIRNIIEDGDGNVFCSTDLGVYRLRRFAGRGTITWIQTPIFGPRSTDAFALLYDAYRDRIIVSNELGIFETTNAGDYWAFSSEMTEQRPMYDLYQSGNSLFSITKYMIWRRNSSDSEFVRIATLDASMSRRIIIWKDRIFVTTDEGLLVSKPYQDIYNDTDLKFELAFPSMNRGTYVAPVTAIRIILGNLITGTEEKIFVSTRVGSIAMISDIAGGIIPTVYIDGVEQKIGYRFTTSTQAQRKFLCFDEKQKSSSKITIANQYQKYQAVKGGWADTDFASSVTVFINGRKINEGSIAEKPIQEIAALRWPAYSDRNANKATADLAFARVQSSLATLLTFEQRDQSTVFIAFTRDNVTSSLFAIERFLSQIYASARVIEELDTDGVEVFRDENGNIVDQGTPGATKSYIPFVMPAFNVNLLSCNIDPALVGISSYGIYNELYTSTAGPGLFGSDLDQDGNSTGTGGSSGESTGTGSSEGTSGTGTSGGSTGTGGGRGNIAPGGG